MSDFDNAARELGLKIEREISAVNEKYLSLSNRVEGLEKVTMSINESIENINYGFQQINKSILGLVSNLKDMEESKKEAVKDVMEEKKPIVSVSKTMGGSLRKLAIETVGVVLTVTDKTSESVSGFRKGLGNIV